MTITMFDRKNITLHPQLMSSLFSPVEKGQQDHQLITNQPTSRILGACSAAWLLLSTTGVTPVFDPFRKARARENSNYPYKIFTFHYHWLQWQYRRWSVGRWWFICVSDLDQLQVRGQLVMMGGRLPSLG